MSGKSRNCPGSADAPIRIPKAVAEQIATVCLLSVSTSQFPPQMHVPGHVLGPPTPGRAPIVSVCLHSSHPASCSGHSPPGEPPFPASAILHVIHPDPGPSLWRGHTLRPAAILILSHIPSCRVTGPLPPSEALVWKGPVGEKCKLPALVNKIAEICMAQSSPEMPPTREWVGSGQQVAASKKRKLRNMITTICGRCE